MAIAVASAQLAHAQAVSAYQGEIVVTSAGQPLSPWIERKGCVAGSVKCSLMIINPTTKEIAKYGDKLSSRFEMTGKGSEIRRAEKAADKAVRLNAAQ